MTVKKYALASDPPQLKAAFADLGLSEISGSKDEPRIVQMFADVGHSWVKDDETAWCAAAVGSWLKKAGKPHTGSLTARSYLQWGRATTAPKRGDVVVFTRGTGWQGHVALYLGEEAGRVWVIGGNQSNRVSITSYPKSKLLGYRTDRPSTKAPVYVATAAGASSIGVAEASQQDPQVLTDQLGQAGYALQAVGHISQWLYLLGTALILGGIGWAIYQYWRQSRA